MPGSKQVSPIELMGTFHIKLMGILHKINNLLLLEKHYWCNARSSSIFLCLPSKNVNETGTCHTERFAEQIVGA